MICEQCNGKKYFEIDGFSTTAKTVAAERVLCDECNGTGKVEPIGPGWKTLGIHRRYKRRKKDPNNPVLVQYSTSSRTKIYSPKLGTYLSREQLMDLFMLAPKAFKVINSVTDADVTAEVIAPILAQLAPSTVLHHFRKAKRA